MSKQIIISKNKRQEQKHEPHATFLRADISQTSASDRNSQTAYSNAGNCIPINPKAELLTLEKLRSFPGCDHYTDEEALGVIESLNTLARIILGTVPKSGTPIDNHQVLHLESNIKSTKKAA